MPRPKGSKNKSNMGKEIMNETPREFDYAEDDGNFDSNFNPLGTQTVATEPYRLSTPIDPKSFVTNTTVNTLNATNITLDKFTPHERAFNTKLFLVEGDVQLSSRNPGQGVSRSKQTRIVYATSDDEALAKFIGYFSTLSNEQQIYAVTAAGATEAIV